MPFYKLFQFQVQTRPVDFAGTEDVTLDKWYEPLTAPVRRVFSAALVAASGLAPLPPNPVVPPPDAWAGQFIEPARQRSGLGAHLQQSFTTDPAPIAAVTEDIGWYSPYSDPVRARLGLSTQQQSFTAFAPYPIPPDVVATTTRGSQVFAQKRFIYQAATPTIFVQTATPGTGNAVISAVLIDVPREYRFQYQGHTAPVSVRTPEVEVTTSTSPLIYKERFIYQTTTGTAFFTPEVVTVDKWFAPWREPTRLRSPRASLQGEFFWGSHTPAPDAASWYAPWREPKRSRTLKTADQQGFFWSTHTPAGEIVTVDKWYAPWREPVRQRAGLPASRQMFTTSISPFPIPPDVVTTTTLGSPVFAQKRFIYQATTPTIFVAPATPGTGNAVISALSVGVPREHRFQYQGYTAPVFVQAPEVAVTTSTSPVIYKERFIYQSTTQTVFFTPEIVTLDKWYAPWREPSRRKPVAALAASSGSPFFAPEIATLDKWYAPWRDPVRQKRGQKTQLQQSFTTDPYPVVVVQDIGWNAALSEPIRLKRGLRSSLQPYYTNDTQPIPTSRGIGWYSPLSEPVRLPKGLKAQLQRFYTADTQPIPTSKGIGWFEQFSEPYPYKRGLKAHLQQFFTTDPSWIPHPSRFLSGWFNWLSEPKRFPKGLKAWLQQAAISTEIPPGLAPDVVIAISAVETNSDILSAALIMSEASQRALVSIREIPVPQNDPVSIVEV